MADRGEDREIKQRTNAKEAEVIGEDKQLLRKAKEDLNAKKKARVQGQVIASKPENDRMVR